MLVKRHVRNKGFVTQERSDVAVSLQPSDHPVSIGVASFGAKATRKKHVTTGGNVIPPQGFVNVILAGPVRYVKKDSVGQQKESKLLAVAMEHAFQTKEYANVPAIIGGERAKRRSAGVSTRSAVVTGSAHSRVRTPVSASVILELQAMPANIEAAQLKTAVGTASAITEMENVLASITGLGRDAQTETA